MSPTLTIDRAGDVAELTLCRPELLNRFDRSLHHDFTAALADLTRDSSVRAIVLASTGKAFSAGGDFEWMREANRDPGCRRELIHDARALLSTLIAVRQPIVVAMQGAAAGLGASVALACDAIVASRHATLLDSHVNVGLVAGDGGCLLWPAAVGMLRARRHLLTGDPLDAETAFRIGLVTDLVDAPEDVLPAARSLAARIASLPPLAVQGTKQVLNAIVQQRASEIVDLALANEDATFASDDLIEGITAFKERRTGTYVGR